MAGKTLAGSPAKVTPDTHTQTSSEPTTERVARRAYERWQERGCPHGCDQQDWFEAEQELKNGKPRK